jgi:hypothetical protein
MKKIKRLSISLVLSLIGILAVSTEVFAVPADVTGFVMNPSNTSIIISWQPASGAVSYLARYRTDTYPTTTADGTVAYNGTQTMATVSSLTAGQTYYFSVWSYDGAAYSTTETHGAVTTLVAQIPSGGQTSQSNNIPVPTVPAKATQTPVITGFHLSPFSDILSYSNNASFGGLGMPIANLWEVVAILIIVIASLLTYIKLKNFFVAYFVMLIASMICYGIGLVQGYLIPVELVVGLGTWALERYFQ